MKLLCVWRYRTTDGYLGNRMTVFFFYSTHFVKFEAKIIKPMNITSETLRQEYQTPALRIIPVKVENAICSNEFPMDVLLVVLHLPDFLDTEFVNGLTIFRAEVAESDQAFIFEERKGPRFRDQEVAGSSPVIQTIRNQALTATWVLFPFLWVAVLS